MQRARGQDEAGGGQAVGCGECVAAACGIPAETFAYRLGSRSALEWVIDQYQVKGESDPNREDDPGYIVRLVGQVVRVSVETARIVRGLPEFR
ncbi:MAG: type ISP restriction/modification enzyme [Bryobacteraceae bacterium]